MTSLLFFSCKKEKKPIVDPAPSPIPSVFLKDMVVPSLPSPYYHFEYDGSGRVSFVSFASEFSRYDVFYNAGRISEMKNNILVNQDELKYTYDNTGKVISINYANSNGDVYTKVSFTYDGQKLVKLDRERKSGNIFVNDKTLTMAYFPDGNLMDLNFHYLPFNGQPESTFKDHFEQYDNKINVDAFGLFHNEFFDHLFLLPGVQLQKNNPGKETRSGDGVNFTVDYTYTYSDKNAPLTKNGDFVYLNGPQAGQHFATSSIFTYY
jgi:hypothetical protein